MKNCLHASCKFGLNWSYEFKNSVAVKVLKTVNFECIDCGRKVDDIPDLVPQFVLDIIKQNSPNMYQQIVERTTIGKLRVEGKPTCADGNMDHLKINPAG